MAALLNAGFSDSEVTLVTFALRCFGVGGGGGAPCLGGPGGGGFFFPVADEGEVVLPPLVCFSSFPGIGTFGGRGSFFVAASPLPLEVGAEPSVDDGFRNGIDGNGLDGTRVKDCLFSNEGGGGGFFPPGGGGGFFDNDPFGIDTGGGAALGVIFGDNGGGGGGFGDSPPPETLAPGLDFNFGGATGGVVGVDGGVNLASIEPRFVRWAGGIVALGVVLEGD